MRHTDKVKLLLDAHVAHHVHLVDRTTKATTTKCQQAAEGSTDICMCLSNKRLRRKFDPGKRFFVCLFGANNCAATFPYSTSFRVPFRAEYCAAGSLNNASHVPFRSVNLRRGFTAQLRRDAKGIVDNMI